MISLCWRTSESGAIHNRYRTCCTNNHVLSFTCTTLHKLAQDFLCTVAAGCLETRQDGKEHCSSYSPIKGTTRTSTHFAFVSERAFFNGTNCMILGSCTVGNVARACSSLKLWANYFHLQGKMSSLCLQKWRQKSNSWLTFSEDICARLRRRTRPCPQGHFAWM